jgi:hypothetical protein
VRLFFLSVFSCFGQDSCCRIKSHLFALRACSISDAQFSVSSEFLHYLPIKFRGQVHIF